jgi:hypothetical protein
MERLRFVAGVLGFMVEVVVVDWLHFLFGGYCFALGRRFVELLGGV